MFAWSGKLLLPRLAPQSAFLLSSHSALREILSQSRRSQWKKHLKMLKPSKDFHPSVLLVSVILLSLDLRFIWPHARQFITLNWYSLPFPSSRDSLFPSLRPHYAQQQQKKNGEKARREVSLPDNPNHFSLERCICSHLDFVSGWSFLLLQKPKE